MCHYVKAPQPFLMNLNVEGCVCAQEFVLAEYLV